MTDVLLFIMILLLCVVATQNMVLYSRIARKDKKNVLDEKVQESMDEEERRSRFMDEGFDNLMRFSVRGNDGFGGADQ